MRPPSKIEVHKALKALHKDRTRSGTKIKFFRNPPRPSPPPKGRGPQRGLGGLDPVDEKRKRKKSKQQKSHMEKINTA